mmetsp:Transcript_27973/g.82263  ORF Transcript_27973/g.82263 Transcript_27973/m.82263 type:complete len:345 (-) Transcript_27973:228-1262(-)|eukprot:CAMPEP_0113537330 /NCGR_PEP_ID=MMETSP0015_2-20120614/6769_1 /TAXON_ID=2838 /ORGANISM="Odontella" /LENGTH=344 /DNA_ID=CAMNT_0000436819 /DNA_START=152 /DNA_END=1186 /DNA_ORIENTATION=- /assembly_acc=CAM_ASM_000160
MVFRLTAIIISLVSAAKSFHHAPTLGHPSRQCTVAPRSLLPIKLRSEGDDGEHSTDGRRSFLASAGLPFMAALASQVLAPSAAMAGIDVSGLRAEGGGVSGGSSLASQLKSYDGSAATRVQQIRSTQAESSVSAVTARPSVQASASSTEPIATAALRYGDTFTRMTKLDFGQRLRYDDFMVGPGTSRLGVSFEYPSDWLQLDKVLGTMEFVDQRNGDKLYVLRAPLPPDTTLLTAPKQYFGEAIFDPKGSISKGGTTIDEYRVSKSTVINDAPYTAARRRFLMKYATVTGNGLRIERRALVDAYEVGNEVYMLMTSSNAVKFDKGGLERETVEKIVDSFQVEKV